MKRKERHLEFGIDQSKKKKRKRNGEEIDDSSFLAFHTWVTHKKKYEHVAVFWDLNIVPRMKLDSTIVNGFFEFFQSKKSTTDPIFFNMYLDFQKFKDGKWVKNPLLKDWKSFLQSPKFSNHVQDTTKFNIRSNDDFQPQENLIVMDICFWKSDHPPPGLIILILDQIDGMETDLIRRLVCTQKYDVQIYTPNTDSNFIAARNWCRIYDFKKLSNVFTK